MGPFRAKALSTLQVRLDKRVAFSCIGATTKMVEGGPAGIVAHVSKPMLDLMMGHLCGGCRPVSVEIMNMDRGRFSKSVTVMSSDLHFLTGDIFCGEHHILWGLDETAGIRWDEWKTFWNQPKTAGGGMRVNDTVLWSDKLGIGCEVKFFPKRMTEGSDIFNCGIKILVRGDKYLCGIDSFRPKGLTLILPGERVVVRFEEEDFPLVFNGGWASLEPKIIDVISSNEEIAETELEW
jgi:hypothetical protein